jgi:hypothetical protein
MRIALVLAFIALAGCAAEKLALSPSAGVDLSGVWKLNEADSDDPQRLLQSQIARATASAGAGGSTGSSGRGGNGGGAVRGPVGPATPSIVVLDEGLRWPGKSVSINQSGGVVTFTSGGRNRVCRPGEGVPPQAHDAAHGRGSVPPPVCGWDDKTLVVQSSDPEDERPPYEQRFSLSDNGRRLIEVVSFKGGRSSGFTASRVWDRVPSDSQP